MSDVAVREPKKTVAIKAASLKIGVMPVNSLRTTGSEVKPDASPVDKVGVRVVLVAGASVTLPSAVWGGRKFINSPRTRTDANGVRLGFRKLVRVANLEGDRAGL